MNDRFHYFHPDQGTPELPDNLQGELSTKSILQDIRDRVNTRTETYDLRETMNYKYKVGDTVLCSKYGDRWSRSVIKELTTWGSNDDEPAYVVVSSDDTTGLIEETHIDGLYAITDEELATEFRLLDKRQKAIFNILEDRGYIIEGPNGKIVEYLEAGAIYKYTTVKTEI